MLRSLLQMTILFHLAALRLIELRHRDVSLRLILRVGHCGLVILLDAHRVWLLGRGDAVMRGRVESIHAVVQKLRLLLVQSFGLFLFESAFMYSYARGVVK